MAQYLLSVLDTDSNHEDPNSFGGFESAEAAQASWDATGRFNDKLKAEGSAIEQLSSRHDVVDGQVAAELHRSRGLIAAPHATLVTLDCILSVVTLQQPGATGAEATSLVTLGGGLVATYNWSFLLGQSLMPGLNALMIGTVLYRSGLVPRAIPALGLIGAPLLITATIATLFGVFEQYSAVPVLAAVPIGVWELSLGLWLTFKGFKSSAPLMIAAAARSGSPDGPASARPSGTVVAAKAGAA